MKNLVKVALLATGIFAAAQTQAQTHRDTTVGQKLDKGISTVGKTATKVGKATAKTAKKVGNATADGATAVGNKTSEIAAKGAAAVVDKKYDGKGGPNKEIVYIDSKSRYYYVNKSGNRVFITEAEMTVRP